jgi:hypothetical protein
MGGPRGGAKGSWAWKPCRSYSRLLRSLVASRYARAPSRSQRSSTGAIKAEPMPWPCQAGSTPRNCRYQLGPVRVVVVEQLVDPQEAGRVGAGQLLDPPAQLLGVLAADRDPTGRRPQRGRDHVSCGGVALVVA